MGDERGAMASVRGPNAHLDFDEELVNRAVREVGSHAGAWVLTTPLERAALLRQIVDDTLEVSNEWCAAACLAKGYEPTSAEGGEELFSGVGTFMRMAQALRRSMLDLATKGRPLYPGPTFHKPGERLAVRVMPSSIFDRILYRGVSAEVWMEPGVSEEEVKVSQASLYRTMPGTPGVSLVLGAGNVASLGPRDVLSKLFVEGHVVVLKANPVNDYLVPYWSKALRALIDGGYLRIVEGGASVGAYLANHDGVTDVHVTGSDKTHDAIVFGVGEEGARRKASSDPRLAKPVSCELGNVSPVVIVPGRWSKSEIEFQAKHVATMLVNNAGFNCLTPRVLVTHAAWSQRQEFLDTLESVLSSLPTRRAYYPGAKERHDAFLAHHPEAHQLGTAADGALAWTLIRDVDPGATDDVVFNVEAFFALCSETALEASSPAAFVRAATDFCNDVLWGTLSMTLLADPRAMRD
ncbi:MAG: aldehyde dehydrogenase family protein, partial [Acidimicrobiales bacterium]